MSLIKACYRVCYTMVKFHGCFGVKEKDTDAYNWLTKFGI